jgi:hypothetical protein
MTDGTFARPLDDGSTCLDEMLDAPLDSPALSRLLDEVRGDDADVMRSYNRTYNRHNR